jgi:arylsulfatase A-like enzyme
MHVGERYRCEDEWCNEHASGLTVTPKETHEAFFLAALACDTLRELARTREPFSLRVDFWGPHQPYFPTREFADLYDPAAIPEYGNFRDDLAKKPDVYHKEWNEPLHEKGRIVVPSPLPWREWQQVLARCYAHTTMVDAASGLILDALDELGLTENTFVIWTTDHGDALACHGGHFDKASYMPEEMMRVPMAVRWPGRIPPGQTSDRLVSLIDVAPTILDAAGTHFDNRIDGTSLLPLCEGRAAAWRTDLMAETHGHGENVEGRMLVNDRYRFVATRGQMHELYDLVDDPYELCNLVEDPAFAGTLEDCRQRLRVWQQMTHDEEEVV